MQWSLAQGESDAEGQESKTCSAVEEVNPRESNGLKSGQATFWIEDANHQNMEEALNELQEDEEVNQRRFIYSKLYSKVFNSLCALLVSGR